MAEVTIFLKDTPEGGVYIHTEYKPGVGNPCTRAQQAALEIINRTAREFGLPSVPPVKLRPVLPASVTRAAIAADTRPHHHLTGGTDL